MSPEDFVKQLLSKYGDNLVFETPPDKSLGDLAVPCFQFAKALQKSPADIATQLASEIEVKSPLAKVVATGPYLNVFFDRAVIANEVLYSEINFEPKNKKLVIEYVGPNTNKPLHLGHLRNMLLGSTLVRIGKAAGYDVAAVNINNDRGVHICKSMLAYQKFGNNETPESMNMKSDHFVGHWYVEFAKKATPELEQEAQDMLKKWEDGDPEIVDLWRQMNEWAFAGFQETYQRIGVSFDKEYMESEHFEGGKQIVLDNLEKGVFERDDNNNVVVDLGKLGKKVLLRADNTTVYITQDLQLAELRMNDFHPDSMVYVVGAEQEVHFKQLFAILKLLGFEHADNYYHLSYGLISLPEGRMKSREGTVVDTDDLLDEVESLATQQVLEKHPDLHASDSQDRGRVIGHGALRYYFLKFEPKTGFTYDPSESLSLEGDTGPYVQYAVARINSIFREASPSKADVSSLVSDPEYELVTLMRSTVSVVEEAASHYKPHLVARHAMSLAQAFTSFYHECPVLKADDATKAARLYLLDKVRNHLVFLLNLLGIDTLSEM